MSITAAAWRGLFCAGTSFSFNHTAQSSTQQVPFKLQAVDLYGFFLTGWPIFRFHQIPSKQI
jgi:hypothetical protein